MVSDDVQNLNLRKLRGWGEYDYVLVLRIVLALFQHTQQSLLQMSLLLNFDWKPAVDFHALVIHEVSVVLGVNYDIFVRLATHNDIELGAEQ